MARFRAMPPDKQKVGETRAAEPQTCGDIAQRDVIPPIHPGTDMARYERLGQVKIRGVSTPLFGAGLAHCSAVAVPNA